MASPEDGGFSAGAHTDYGCLTFLMTDGTPGLQICPDGEWVAVPHIRGAFVINLGDMLERWTGGLYRSTLHRVVCTCGKERFSAAFFVEPSFETVVQVFPEVRGSSGEGFLGGTSAVRITLTASVCVGAGYGRRMRRNNVAWTPDANPPPFTYVCSAWQRAARATPPSSLGSTC